MPRSRDIERKIKFYRFDLGKDAARQPISLNVASLFQRLHMLDDNARTHEMTDDEITYLCCVDRHTIAPYHARFIKVKRRDVPQIYNANNQARDLEDEEGIGEAVHAIFFPNNVIAIEGNKNGPSAYAICSYLRHIAPQICSSDMACRQLVWGETARRLGRLENLTSMTLKFRRGFAAHHAEIYNGLGNLQQALTGLETINNVGDIAITVTAQDSRKRSGVVGFSNELRQFIGRLASGRISDSDLKQLSVKGFDTESHQREEINILDNLLVLKKKMIKMNEKGRTILSSDAYNKIEEAYNEHLTDIANADELL